MLKTFTLQLLAWAGGLALVHSGLRALSATSAPGSFLSDLMAFSAAMLSLAALAAGIATSRDLSIRSSSGVRALLSVLGVCTLVGAMAYGVVDQVAPRVLSNVVSDRGSEPGALTSAELRVEGRAAVAAAETLDQAGSPSTSAWQRVNRLAFEHELRIVQALLIPLMGLIGVLAGARATSLPVAMRMPALWGLGLFLVFSMFMSGENGYELIVLRSAGPMAFVAWLQAVVPGCVLVGLGFAALPDLLAPEPAESDSSLL